MCMITCIKICSSRAVSGSKNIIQQKQEKVGNVASTKEVQMYKTQGANLM